MNIGSFIIRIKGPKMISMEIAYTFGHYFCLSIEYIILLNISQVNTKHAYIYYD